MKTHSSSNPSHPESGTVLVLSLLLLLALGGLTSGLFFVNFRLHEEHGHAVEDLRAFCVAEAGLNEAYAVLKENDVAGVNALADPRVIGTGSYRLEMIDGRDDHTIDVDRIRLRSVGEAGRDAVGVQLMVWHVPTGAYQFALFGDKGLKLNSNVDVDSFDSNDGPYPGEEFANDFGNVGSFDQLSIDSNVEIHGDALVGPDGVFDDDSSGVEISGDHEARPIELNMDAIAVPPLVTLGTLNTSGSTTIPPGLYHYTALNVNGGTLKIKGPATLVVDSFWTKSSSNIEIDGTDGPVKIYATGNFELNSGTKVTTTSMRARDLEVLITSSNISPGTAKITLDSNTDFYGTIYAPNASLKVSSNFKIFGSVRSSLLELASNGHVHYDEDLLYDQVVPHIYERFSWRRLSREETLALQAAPVAAP